MDHSLLLAHMPRIANSSTVPSFLAVALSNIRRAQRVPKLAPTPVNVRKASLSVLPLTEIAQRKLIAHGAGVFEDPKNHSIWYKEGEVLKRRQTDLDQVVKDYIDSIK